MTAHDHDLAIRPAQPVAAHINTAARQATKIGGIYGGSAKRILDVALVLVSAPVVVPIIILLAFLLWCEGGSPFYSQQRVGRGGRLYRMWKLRSMVTDADACFASHLAADPAARAEWNATQKLKDDPRITHLGRVLRRSSLDELPQLWNVVTGDMSLVGPRPMLPSQQAIYAGRAYYGLRPGLTGPWQVSTRNESMFSERAAFDEWYAQNLSLTTDIKLIFRTFSVVLRATGH